MTDEEFLAAFENCTLPFEQWNHRAHVRVAYLYASCLDVDSATQRMRSGVKAYNKANRVPEALDQGYHETITVAFMRLISEAAALGDHAGSFDEFAQLWPQLFDKRALLRFYSRHRIMSAEAKASYVEPDLMPLSAEALGSLPDQLVVFDVDGTLIQSIGIDDRCFAQAVSDVLGITGISTDWADYQYQTDAGLIFEIASQHLGTPPSDELTSRVREQFLHLLSREAKAPGFTLPEVPGACSVLDVLRYHPRWCAAIATGGWATPAKLKLGHASVPIEGIPFASCDDAMPREEIIECATRRAEQHHGRRAFREIVYVGDGSWDAIAAQRLGIGFIAVRTNSAASTWDDDGSPAVRDFSDPHAFIRLLDSVVSK